MPMTEWMFVCVVMSISDERDGPSILGQADAHRGADAALMQWEGQRRPGARRVQARIKRLTKR
jgi:hypothetical protein